MSERSAYTLRLPGAVVLGLTSTGDLELGSDQELLLGAYLPGIMLEEGVADDTQVLVRHVESSEAGLDQNHQEVEIRDRWNNAYPTDLPYLLSGIARTLWIRRGIYPVHAACVASGDASLLPGNSGAGKSTVSLELATKYGQEMYSGNTTLVRFGDGGMEAVAGTRTMSLCTEDYARRDYDVATSVEYGDRTAFLLAPEYYANGASRNIGRVALLRLSDRARQWRRLQPASALHQLYPQFVDALREDTIVAGGAGVYVGATAAESRRQLAGSLHDSLVSTPAWQGTGDKTYLSERLAET